MPVIEEQQISALAPKFEATAQAARFIAFDLETGDPEKEAIQDAQDLVTHHPGTKDEEKQAAQIKEKRATIEEKAALLDAAPITCGTFITENARALFYHLDYPWKRGSKPVKTLKGWDGEIRYAKTEREMLVDLRSWLDARAIPRSVLIGHNIWGFDLPKSRSAYVRHRLRLPKVLMPEAKSAGVEVYDTMDKFLKNFTVECRSKRFISVEEMSARLGFPVHKQYARGEEMPEMARKGEVQEVLTYNFLDGLNAYASFLVMTGNYQDQAE